MFVGCERRTWASLRLCDGLVSSIVFALVLWKTRSFGKCTLDGSSGNTISSQLLCEPNASQHLCADIGATWILTMDAKQEATDGNRLYIRNGGVQKRIGASVWTDCD